MTTKSVPCILMRGGTSCGPYLNSSDLPKERDELASYLLRLMGTGSPFQVDGVGGGQPTTSKVAMLSKSDDPWADIDYFFAQVHTEKMDVDFNPTCGNILAGVGPAAIEMGLVQPTGDKTAVNILSTNTGARVEAIVETPGGVVNYDGDVTLDGIAGSSAPVILNFMNVIGSNTGSLFPTGKPLEVIGGYTVTCIDVAMPMVIGLAAEFGITGYESRDELDKNKKLFERLEAVRLEAGKKMGLGDVSRLVIPKFGLLAAPQDTGTIAARYFMPWKTHPTYAVSGSICTGSCLLAPGTVAAGLANISEERPITLQIEHPKGVIDVVFDYRINNNEIDLKSSGLIRTARKLFSGEAHVPVGD